MEAVTLKFKESLIENGSFVHGLENDLSIDKLVNAFEELFPLLRMYRSFRFPANLQN